MESTSKNAEKTLIKEDKFSYSGIDLIEEQFFGFDTLGLSGVDESRDINNKGMHTITTNSIFSVGSSQWKVSTKFVKTVEFELDYEKEFVEGWHFKFGLSSLHIQLEQFSWHIYGDSQSEISLECILFRPNMYQQEILKKQRISIDKKSTPVGTVVLHYDNDEKDPLSYVDQEIANELYECKAFALGIVIRLLRTRASVSPILANSLFQCDKVLIVCGRRFPVNSTLISMASPVFAAMFGHDMMERHMNEIELKDVSSADDFAAFLAKLSPFNFGLNAKPNPSDVMPMAILASRFQVIALLDLCERHLINCVELPVLDRLLFADKYGLVGLKERMMECVFPMHHQPKYFKGPTRNAYTVNKFFKENKDTLDKYPKLLDEFRNFAPRR